MAVKKLLVVDLSAPPNLPFDGATIVLPLGTGTVKLEKRKDGLYVDDYKVIFYFSERQKNGNTVRGYDLRDEVTGQPVLNANILDALIANPEFIPEDFKKDEQGKPRHIFFWGTIYRNSGDGLYVRYLYWNDSSCHWYWDFDWLEKYFDGNNPAAVLGS